jgi:hypothetical protein
MTSAVVNVLIVAFVGWILAALMVGLWLGERGRRAAAERLVVYGSPDAGAGTQPVSRAPSKEAEDRLRDVEFEFSEETVSRAMADLKVAADAQGLTVSEDQLRNEALRLLGGQSVDE